MRYYTYWLFVAYLIAETAKAKKEARYWRAKHLRKHLMFKLATEDFNAAYKLLTREEQERILAVFNANEEFLAIVTGDIEI